MGGQASQIHGAERRTFDLDICLRWTPDKKETLSRPSDLQSLPELLSLLGAQRE